MNHHAVFMDYNRCRGCTSCIKSCPTEAIRVRNGKATILENRCIDCGKCIQVCPHRAIRAAGDTLDLLQNFDYCIALPEPALYGQFQNLNDINYILNGLLNIGFHKIFEISKAAEYLAGYIHTKPIIKENQPLPLISASCPAALRLVRMRFPRLIDHIADIVLPMELAARLARQEAQEESGLPPERIGVFSIVPCSAKVALSHRPEVLNQAVIDGAFPIRDIYLKLLTPMKQLQQEGKPLPDLISAGRTGIHWAACGAESRVRQNQRCIVADGIDNLVRVLEEVEDGRIPDVDLIELSACTQGCLGGCFNAENPYAARMRLSDLAKQLPETLNHLPESEDARKQLIPDSKPDYLPAFLLDTDRAAAMEKQLRIQELERALPGLHCASCGAPSCHAFAEDVVLGRAKEEDCIFKMRARMHNMTGSGDINDYLPPPFRRQTQSPEDTSAH